MKVVINNCYGGFGLSSQAIEKCIELGMSCVDDNLPDYNEQSTDFVKLLKGRRKNSKKPYEYYVGNNHIYWSAKTLRTHPIVLKVVEELGEKSFGFCSKLRIINIPFDSLDGWEIEAHDGREWIQEEVEKYY